MDLDYKAYICINIELVKQNPQWPLEPLYRDIYAVNKRVIIDKAESRAYIILIIVNNFIKQII